MKKLISVILSLILTAPLCFGLKNFHFSLAPRFSFTYGELTELLYDDDDSQTLVSRLDWEQKPLFNIGLEAGFSYKNFLLSAAFDYSFPLGTSYMYDSDWEDGEKFSFTKHPLADSKNINTELSFAYELAATNKLSVIPELQFNYIYSDFKADRGSGTRYGRSIRVYGVDYNRHSFIIFTGLSVKAEVIEKIFFKTAFFAAPWLYQDCFDYHHGVKHPFSSRDILYASFTKYKIDFACDFIYNRQLSLELFTSFLFGFPDQGEIYSDYFGSWAHITEQKGGAAINYIKSGINLKLTF